MTAHKASPAVLSRAGFLHLGASLTALLAVAGCGGGSGSGNPEDSGGRKFALSTLQQVTVPITNSNFRLWVMDTAAKRDEGMMNLTDAEVADDEGMLFAFPDSQVRYFWMKNTGLPLDIAYLDSHGTVVSTWPLQPYDLTAVSSLQPAQYAIEVKQGTFARIGLATGMTVTLPPVSAK